MKLLPWGSGKEIGEYMPIMSPDSTPYQKKMQIDVEQENQADEIKKSYKPNSIIFMNH